MLHCILLLLLNRSWKVLICLLFLYTCNSSWIDCLYWLHCSMFALKVYMSVHRLDILRLWLLSSINFLLIKLTKLLHRFKPNVAQWQRPQKCTSWVVQTGVLYNISKMADGRHLQKSKTAISPQRFDRPAQNLARWPILALQRVWAINIIQLLRIQDGMVTHFDPPKIMGS